MSVQMHFMEKQKNLLMRRKLWKEKCIHIQCFVKFWYSDWGVISRASWSVLWNIASSREHYRHASQGRALRRVPLSHYEIGWLCTTSAPSRHGRDLRYSIVYQGFPFATYMRVCVPTFSHNHVSPIRDPVEELKEKDSRHLQKGCYVNHQCVGEGGAHS